MYQDQFVPLTAKIILTAEGERDSAFWQEQARSLTELCIAAAETQNALIGHIKSYATLPDGGYIKCSYADSLTGLGTERQDKGRPCRQIKITFNVLAAGLASSALRQFLEEGARCLAACSAVVKMQATAHHHNHNEEHHHHEM